MRIGIAAPIEVFSLKNHLSNLTENDLKLGLGGTAINILVDGFIKSGHHVTIFTLDPNIGNKYILEGPNLKIIFGHFRKKSIVKTFDFCQNEFLTIKRLIEDNNSIDIVNAHWSYEYAIGTILAKVPHIITFRDHSQTILRLMKHPYRLTRLLMDLWVRNSTIFFSYNSPYLKSLIGLDGPVIPNPIRDGELTGTKPFPAQNKTLKICYIANGWDKRKNPEAGIKAFNLLKKEFPNVEFHLFGKGCESIGKNRAKVKKMELDDSIVFRGPLSHTKLMDELEGFDVMLHTAREESFGNNLVEAMAKGVPVIAGQYSGAVPWVLDNGKAGCLTDIESPHKIYHALKRIITDHRYYNTLSKNGIENLKNRFTQKKVCEAYLSEYEKIIERNNDGITSI